MQTMRRLTVAASIAAAFCTLALGAKAFAQSVTQPYQELDRVEVYDPDNDEWDPCTVDQAFPGAYKVTCNSGKTLQRDIHVRKVGEQAAGQTAGREVSGPPFRKNDVVLATISGQPDQFKLCIILQSFMSNGMGYDVDCGTGPFRVQARWVKQAGAPLRPRDQAAQAPLQVSAPPQPVEVPRQETVASDPSEKSQQVPAGRGEAPTGRYECYLGTTGSVVVSLSAAGGYEAADGSGGSFAFETRDVGHNGPFSKYKIRGGSLDGFYFLQWDGGKLQLGSVGWGQCEQR